MRDNGTVRLLEPTFFRAVLLPEVFMEKQPFHLLKVSPPLIYGLIFIDETICLNLGSKIIFEEGEELRAVRKTTSSGLK